MKKSNDDINARLEHYREEGIDKEETFIMTTLMCAVGVSFFLFMLVLGALFVSLFESIFG